VGWRPCGVSGAVRYETEPPSFSVAAAAWPVMTRPTAARKELDEELPRDRTKLGSMDMAATPALACPKACDTESSMSTLASSRTACRHTCRP
jgi:hypothetical protein